MTTERIHDEFDGLRRAILALAPIVGSQGIERIAKQAQRYHDAVQAYIQKKTYRYTLDDADIRALRKIHQYVLDQQTYEVDVRQAGLSYADRSRVTQLRFHGMLAKALTKEGKHKPSTWILTRRAAQFLKSECRVPKWVETCDNKLTGIKSEEYVSAKDFRILDDFDPHFEIVGLSANPDLVRILRLPLPV